MNNKYMKKLLRLHGARACDGMQCRAPIMHSICEHAMMSHHELHAATDCATLLSLEEISILAT